MKLIARIASIVLSLALAVLAGAAAWWLFTHKTAAVKADKPVPPASVAKVVKEGELNDITLTGDAEKRLGLKLGEVESKDVRRVRVYGGEVTVPIGKTVLVAAPLGGILKAPDGGMPQVGETLSAKRVVFQLLPFITPEGRTAMAAALVDAQNQVNIAQSQLDATQTALERAQRLLKDGAGSQRNVDEAKAAFDLATKSLEAAKARQKTITKVVGESNGNTASAILLEAPLNGILRTISAKPGQNVPAGAPLFEVVDFSTIWVRVPLPVGDMDEIDRNGDAFVGKLTDPPGAPLCAVKPAPAPPSASPMSATIDLFYEMPNPLGSLIPGQKLSVTIPLNDAKSSLTVPWSAVVFDVHGGTWIYERIGGRSFVRRRVVVRYTIGKDAVLARGPTAGTVIVAEGAQELFGAESEFSK